MICNGASLYLNGVALIDEFIMICLVNLVGWGNILHLVYYTIEDFKRILNIKLFTIKSKKV